MPKHESLKLTRRETLAALGAFALTARFGAAQAPAPAHNIALRRKRNQVLVTLDGAARPRFVPAAAVPLERLHEHYGPFSSRPGARRFLQELAAEHGLCLKTMKLEGRARAAADAPPATPPTIRIRFICKTPLNMR